MFHLRVTIEVVNEVGTVVDHRGYAHTHTSRGVQQRSVQELYAEGKKPMDIAAASNRLNALYAVVRGVADTVYG